MLIDAEKGSDMQKYIVIMALIINSPRSYDFYCMTDSCITSMKKSRICLALFDTHNEEDAKLHCSITFT